MILGAESGLDLGGPGGQFQVNLGSSSGSDPGRISVHLGVDLGDFFSLGIDFRENFQRRPGAKPGPTKFDKK